MVRKARLQSFGRVARIGYRNFFLPHRSDVFAGFRTCSLGDDLDEGKKQSE